MVHPAVVHPEELAALVERLQQMSPPDATTTADVAATLGVDEARVQDALRKIRQEAQAGTEITVTPARRSRFRSWMPISLLLLGGTLFAVVHNARGVISTSSPIVETGPAFVSSPPESIAQDTAPQAVIPEPSASLDTMPIARRTALLTTSLAAALPEGLGIHIGNTVVSGTDPSSVYSEAEAMKAILALERAVGTSPAMEKGYDAKKIRAELRSPDPYSVGGLTFTRIEASVINRAGLPRSTIVHIPSGPREWAFRDSNLEGEITKVREERKRELAKNLAEFAREIIAERR